MYKHIENINKDLKNQNHSGAENTITEMKNHQSDLETDLNGKEKE